MGGSASQRVLGIDLGGTKILAAVVSGSGEVLGRDRKETPAREGADVVMGAIYAAAEKALQQAGLNATDVDAIGLGAAGVSNPDLGILYTSPNVPSLCDFPIKEAVASRFGREPFLINDANAAAVGELTWGGGRGARNFIYVTVSTGIGGGIIIDGEIYTGTTGAAGEIGHMTIDTAGPLCSCGNHGCWEQLASGTALAREARGRIEAGAETSILGLTGGDFARVTAEIISQAAGEGDALAGELITQAGRYLGIGFANLINLFNPELIVIGGGLSNIGDRLLQPAYKEAGARAFPQAYGAVRFVLAELGADSGVLGAGAYAMAEKIKGSTE